jgi:pyruvate kinase
MEGNMHFWKDDKGKLRLLKTKIIATLGKGGRDLFDKKGEILQKRVSYQKLFAWLHEELNDFPIDIIRFNMSFYPDNKKDCQEIFEIFSVDPKKILRNTSMIGDLPGAKTRLGTIKNKEIELKKDKPFKLYLTEKKKGDEKGASVLAYGEPLGNLSNYGEIYTKLIERLTGYNSRGIEISIADGAVILIATKESGGVLECKVKKGGIAKERKGITFHQIDLGLPSFKKNDEEALKFLLNLDNGNGILAYVAISFVRGAEDILKVRRAIEEYFGKKGFLRGRKKFRYPEIIAKIETEDGVNKIDEILDVADGAMIARGDLALQLSLEEVPEVQKRIINLCNKRGKIAITATEMLASMENSPKPTRAEVSDVFNAVMDGTDAVMLSGETAEGKYPIQAVGYMINIAKKAEQYFLKMYKRGGILNGNRLEELRQGSESLIEEARNRMENAKREYQIKGLSWGKVFYEERYESILIQGITDRICHSACELAEDKMFKAIISTTLTGRTARMISRFRPETLIIAAAHNEISRRKLLLSRGVYPINIGEINSNTKRKYASTDEAFEEACKKSVEESLGLFEEDYIVFVSGTPLFSRGLVNQVQIKKILKF